MTLNLNATSVATAAIPLSTATSTAATDPKATNPAVSRRPHEGSGPPPQQPGSTSAAQAYTISGSAAASASHASAKASDVTGVQPDIDGDGARLMALQVQQDLATQTTPIANASSTSILGLFKS